LLLSLKDLGAQGTLPVMINRSVAFSVDSAENVTERLILKSGAAIQLLLAVISWSGAWRGV
jgi:hypothetical protein